MYKLFTACLHGSCFPYCVWFFMSVCQSVLRKVYVMRGSHVLYVSARMHLFEMFFLNCISTQTTHSNTPFPDNYVNLGITGITHNRSSYMYVGYISRWLSVHKHSSKYTPITNYDYVAHAVYVLDTTWCAYTRDICFPLFCFYYGLRY